jgi:hypothetical protein
LQRYQVVERSLVDQFHRDVKQPIIRPARVHLHDVRVIHQGGDCRFVSELPEELRIFAVFLAQQLQCNLSMEV